MVLVLGGRGSEEGDEGRCLGHGGSEGEGDSSSGDGELEHGGGNRVCEWLD